MLIEPWKSVVEGTDIAPSNPQVGSMWAHTLLVGETTNDSAQPVKSFVYLAHMFEDFNVLRRSVGPLQCAPPSAKKMYYHMVSPVLLGGNQRLAERHRARAHDTNSMSTVVSTRGAVDIRECPRRGLVGG